MAITLTGKPIVVTLIHGTWGRGFFAAAPSQSPPIVKAKQENLNWFEPGSAFRDKLKSELLSGGFVAAYDHFEWSGDNSIMERDKAALALASLLRTQTERFPKHSKIVVAHSHGGNVAMRALHYLRETDEIIRVVTVATPFLQMFVQQPESSASKSHENLEFMVGMSLAWLSVLPVFLVGAFTESWIAALCALLMFWTASYVGAAWLVSGRSWRGEERGVRALRLVRACMIPPGQLAPHRLLVIRGAEDEAAFSLAAGAIGARLAYLLTAFGSRLYRSPYAWVAAFVIIVAGLCLMFARTYFSLAAGYLSLVVIALILVAPIAFSLGAIACNAFKCVHGRELAIGGVACEVTSGSAPDSALPHLWIATLNTQWEQLHQWMRHALYDHPFCCRMIALWVVVTFDEDCEKNPQIGNLLDFLHQSPLEGMASWGDRFVKHVEETLEKLIGSSNDTTQQ